MNKTISLLAILLLFGCAGCKEQRAYTYQSPLTDSFEKMRLTGPQGKETKLADVTSFQWDRLYYFPEGSVKADINRTTGAEIFQAGFPDGLNSRFYSESSPLLVFMEKKTLAHAVVVILPINVAGKTKETYTSDRTFVVAMCSNPAGPYVLHFVAKNPNESE